MASKKIPLIRFLPKLSHQERATRPFGTSTRANSERTLWSGEVADTKAADDSVKRRRSEWQLLSAAFSKVKMRVKSVRQHDHCWRDIDTNHARTALCRLCG